MTVNPDRHADVVAELRQRQPEHQIGPSLARIRALTELLGDPQRSAPVIQITGTNGKGSTAIMIDALLRAQGLRTGRYASPHLSDLTERISIDGRPISVDVFDQTWDQIRPYVTMVDAQRIDGLAMTFFEVLTGMAFAVFADAPVDVMVLEVGMGGSWDATNVADAAVAVVTPIGLDHTDYLGESLAEIATEKAGIIKEGSVAVLAGQEPEAARVLVEHCATVGALMVREGGPPRSGDRCCGSRPPRCWTGCICRCTGPTWRITRFSRSLPSKPCRGSGDCRRRWSPRAWAMWWPRPGPSGSGPHRPW